MPAVLPDAESANNGDYSSLFFWLFQPDADQTTDSSNNNNDEDNVEVFRDDTLLLWFNGGPGCSSMVGLMGEMGPVGMKKFGPGIPAPNPDSVIDAPLVYNEYAWTKKSAMLFIEQPGGTGFSTASSEWIGEEAEKRTEDDVARDFWAFLQNIYTVFGDVVKKKLYLSGESYAGMYIPSIARGLHLRNKRMAAGEEGYRSPSLHHIDLRGMAIGNGWIDPYIQGPTSIDYAWWHGMIDLNTYRGLHRKWEQCIADEILDSSEKPFHPFKPPSECGISDAVMEASGSTFMYDVTTYDAYPAALDKHGTIGNFFNNPIVRESLNAPSMADFPFWQACVPGSGRRQRHLEESPTHRQRELILLDNDRPLSVVPYIAELLDDAEIDVLMYNGDLDLACASQSTELALESMDWSGKDSWLDPDTAKFKQWNVDGQPSGHTKKYKNLQFLIVYNSGHFVPINQARNSLNMISRLIEGKSFGDQKLKMFPLRDQMKEQQDAFTSDGAQTDKKGHALTLLSGFIGFLLGVLASNYTARHFAFRKLSSSVTSSPNVGVTETTSLRHADAQYS